MKKSITVKLSSGTTSTYIQPDHCTLEEWDNPLGYCWAFAELQDEGRILSCKDCENYEKEN